MAALVTDPQTGSYSVAAQTTTELALLDHGRKHGGQLVLLEAYFAVVGDRVILPDNLSVQGARRVLAALERAADSHRRAQHRRSDFRLVKTVLGSPKLRRSTSDNRDQ